MKIVKEVMVGSLESNDLLVSVRLSSDLEIIIDSIVIKQYGEDIRKLIEDVLAANNVENGRFHIQDRGALDCTIKARIETAIQRGGEN